MPNPLRVHRLLLMAGGGKKVVPGTPGNAAHFAVASSQSLTRASNADLQLNATDYSFVCWVKLDDLANYRIIASKEQVDASQANMEYEWRVNTGGNLEVTHSNGANYFTVTGPAVSTGVWHFIAIIYDHVGGSVTRYVDTTSANDPIASSPQLQAYTFGLGQDVRSGHSIGMNGAIDAAGLYKRKLTAAEVSTIYNGGVGVRLSDQSQLWTSLVAAWELDETGATWTDWIGSSNLTNNNGVTSVSGKT